jgi:hypothetical protein
MERRTKITVGGKNSAHIDAEELKGLPSVSEKAYQEMVKTGWPADEETTTREIYAAAEAIRQLRPRDPQGHPTGIPVEMPTGTQRPEDGRRFKGVETG